MANDLIQQVALVSESAKVSQNDLMRVSAALQKQASRDLAPIWNIGATVDAFPALEDVPLGYWPMLVRDDIGFDAAGIHLDIDGQPYALISSSDVLDEWSLTASHELIEMLVDPFGNRTVAGDSPKSDQGRVLFLVEACDPSEAAEFGYTVNGILVSDFYTPNYFDPIGSSSVRYSFTNSITEPRKVLRGGYLSWQDPASGHWWQETFFSGSSSKFRDLGVLSASNGSIRSQIDRLSAKNTAAAIKLGRIAALAAGLSTAPNKVSSSAKAEALHATIAALPGMSSTPENVSDTGRRAARRVRGD